MLAHVYIEKMNNVYFWITDKTQEKKKLHKVFHIFKEWNMWEYVRKKTKNQIIELV